MAFALNKLGRFWEALQHYQQAKQIYQALGLEHEVEEYDAAIYHLNQIIPVQQSIRVPRIDDVPLSPRPSRKRRSVPLWFYGLVGVAIALLILWLKR